MDITYNGTLELNKPLTKEAVKAIRGLKYLGDAFTKAVAGDKTITAKEYGRHFEEDLLEVIDALNPFGYVFNGKIGYWGDFDGTVYVKDNYLDDVDISMTGLFESDDKDLIEILKEHGYKVEKAEITTIDGKKIDEIKVGDTVYEQNVYDPNAFFAKKVTKIVDKAEGTIETYEESIKRTRVERISWLYSTIQED